MEFDVTASTVTHYSFFSQKNCFGLLFDCVMLFSVPLVSCYMNIVSQTEPPDETALAALRLMCVKNINDDYCMVLYSSVINDKNADFDVRILCFVDCMNFKWCVCVCA